MFRPALTSLVALLVSGAAGGATTVRFQDGALPTAGYQGTRDVTLTIDGEPNRDPNTNYNLGTLQVDGFAGRKEALLRFDVSAISPGTTVSAASLQLECVNPSTNTLELRPMLVPWVETEVTWNQASSGTPWSVAGAQGEGADFSGASLVSIGSAPTGAVTFTLPNSLVQGWVDAPASNHGLLLRGVQIDDGADFVSCDNGNVGNRPRLTVNAIVFQEGALPTGGYAGCADAVIARGPNSSANADGALLRAANDNNPDHFLLAFALDGLPAGTVVHSGAVAMHAVKTGPGLLGGFGVRRAWVEAAANWATRDGTDPWTQPGADGSGADRDAVFSFELSGAMLGQVSAPLSNEGVQLVQSWLDGARANHGWVVRRATTPVMFSDSQDAFVARRPALTLVVTLPGGDPDAGVDGGTDAGTGPADAGTQLPSDGGTTAAGPTPLRVGCGCGSATTTWGWVGFLAALGGAQRGRRRGEPRR